ncbi:MAG: hypothetical protein K6L75_03875 [Cellvibrionaceae bacterium]
MINIPSTVPTANTEGLKTSSLRGERVARIEKLQDVTDKPESRKMPRKKFKNKKKEAASESQLDNDENQSQSPLQTYTYQSKNKMILGEERRQRIDRRKKTAKNFPFDSRASNTRRSNDGRYPSVDIEV